MLYKDSTWLLEFEQDYLIPKENGSENTWLDDIIALRDELNKTIEILSQEEYDVMQNTNTLIWRARQERLKEELRDSQFMWINEVLPRKDMGWVTDRWGDIPTGKDGRGVYFLSIESDPSAGVKIGQTIHFRNRIKTHFKDQQERPLRVHAVILTQNQVELEKALHRVFWNNKIAGEWFDITDRQLTVIESWTV